MRHAAFDVARKDVDGCSMMDVALASAFVYVPRTFLRVENVDIQMSHRLDFTRYEIFPRVDDEQI